MKVFILFLIALAFVSSEEFYTTKYDGIDIDNILANPRLLNYYIKCLLERGPCNDEGKTLKNVLPDALLTECRKCSVIQRASVVKIGKFLVAERLNDFDALIAKYDPTGEFFTAYRHYLE